MGKREHHYYVYIVASRTHVLYCGITNNLKRRVTEHRDGAIPGFTETYQCNRLVWFEHYQYVGNALDREKQIKSWRRAKKIWLIEQMNPTWADLSEAWTKETAGPYAPPNFPLILVALAKFMRLSQGKPHTWTLVSVRGRKSGYASVGMTKFRAAPWVGAAGG
jgi:putative endonuclease